MQLFQVLEEARERCRYDGEFKIDLTFGNGFNLVIRGNVDAEYHKYEASNWHEDGYNDYEEEVSRTARIDETEVCPPKGDDDEYLLDYDDEAKILEFIQDTDNFN